MRSRGLRSMRAISRAASAGSSPNFEPSWPVSTCAWVSAVTPGITRTSTSCSRPGGLEPVDVVGVVDHDQADPVLGRQRDLLVGLGVAVVDDQRGVDAGLQRGQDLAAAGDVEPQSLLDHHALDRRRGEGLGGEHDARARPARAQRLAVLARPRPQRAARRRSGRACRTRRASASARQPPTTSIPSASSLLDGGKSESRASTRRQAIPSVGGARSWEVQDRRRGFVAGTVAGHVRHRPLPARRQGRRRHRRLLRAGRRVRDRPRRGGRRHRDLRPPRRPPAADRRAGARARAPLPRRDRRRRRPRGLHARDRGDRARARAASTC